LYRFSKLLAVQALKDVEEALQQERAVVYELVVLRHSLRHQQTHLRVDRGNLSQVRHGRRPRVLPLLVKFLQMQPTAESTHRHDAASVPDKPRILPPTLPLLGFIPPSVTNCVLQSALQLDAAHDAGPAPRHMKALLQTLACSGISQQRDALLAPGGPRNPTWHLRMVVPFRHKNLHESCSARIGFLEIPSLSKLVHLTNVEAREDHHPIM
jgi:hypothetical protein